MGVGVGVWAVGTFLSGNKLTLDGLANAALDAFIVSSAIAFVCAGVNAIKFVYRSRTNAKLAGENIVGTQHDQLRPTQDYVSKEKVTEYVHKLKSGEKINPISVAKTSKGNYILDGHHRYVASKMTNIKVDINFVSGGPIGYPNWTYVNWL